MVRVPNRILREGLLDSDAIGAVSPGAEMLFVRLLLLADDYGRYDGRVSVVCRRAFVNRREVDEHMTAEWLAELQAAELIEVYEVDGRAFIEVLNFRQRTRAHGSKYPPKACTAGAASKENQTLTCRIDGHSTDVRQSNDGPARTYSYSKSKTRIPPLPPCGGGGPDDADGDGARPSTDAEAGVGDRGSRTPAIGIKAWLDRCRERGEKPVPDGSAALVYAAQAGIPPEFLALHWREFKTRHAESKKRYRDWRAALLNSIRGNWYGLWLLHSDGTCRLSTKGEQARRVQQASEQGASG